LHGGVQLYENVAAERVAYELGVPSGAAALGVRGGTTGGVGSRAGTDLPVALKSGAP
jgi:hypothetical protein